jgi:hypothetical protein
MQLRNQGGPCGFGGPRRPATAPQLRDLPPVRTHIGIMPVIEDYRPFGLGISARYAGDRGAERPVLEPHDHLHNKHDRASRAAPIIRICVHRGRRCHTPPPRRAAALRASQERNQSQKVTMSWVAMRPDRVGNARSSQTRPASKTAVHRSALAGGRPPKDDQSRTPAMPHTARSGQALRAHLRLRTEACKNFGLRPTVIPSSLGYDRPHAGLKPRRPGRVEALNAV